MFSTKICVTQSLYIGTYSSTRKPTRIFINSPVGYESTHIPYTGNTPACAYLNSQTLVVPTPTLPFSLSGIPPLFHAKARLFRPHSLRRQCLAHESETAENAPPHTRPEKHHLAHRTSLHHPQTATFWRCLRVNTLYFRLISIVCY